MAVWKFCPRWGPPGVVSRVGGGLTPTAVGGDFTAVGRGRTASATVGRGPDRPGRVGHRAHRGCRDRDRADRRALE